MVSVIIKFHSLQPKWDVSGVEPLPSLKDRFKLVRELNGVHYDIESAIEYTLWEELK